MSATAAAAYKDLRGSLSGHVGRAPGAQPTENVRPARARGAAAVSAAAQIDISRLDSLPGVVLGSCPWR